MLLFEYEIIFGKNEPKMDPYFSNHCLKIHLKPLGVFGKKCKLNLLVYFSYITVDGFNCTLIMRFFEFRLLVKARKSRTNLFNEKVNLIAVRFMVTANNLKF